jgi:hypothetical protein
MAPILRHSREALLEEQLRLIRHNGRKSLHTRLASKGRRSTSNPSTVLASISTVPSPSSPYAVSAFLKFGTKARTQACMRAFSTAPRRPICKRYTALSNHFIVSSGSSVDSAITALSNPSIALVWRAHHLLHILTFCFTATDWFIGPRFVVTHRVKQLRGTRRRLSKEQAFNASGHCSVQPSADLRLQDTSL